MSRNNDILVSVITPIYNDGAILSGYLTELSETLSAHYRNYEILFIDDCSTDSTQRVVGELLHKFECVRYLRLSRRFGLEIAITAGLETAIGDYVVVSQPEFDPISKIPEMIELAQGSGAVVLGRVSPESYGWFYRHAYDYFYLFCNRFLALNLLQHTTYFLVLGRPVLNSINQIRDKFRYLKTFTSVVGSQILFFDYQLLHRSGKRWRRGFFEAINLGIDIVVSNSVRPLRAVSLLGLAVSGVNLLYFGYIGLIALFKEKVAEGWITLSTQMALGFFVLSIVLATICEYLGRVLLEAKDRPFYFVAEERNSSVLLSEEATRRNVVSSSLSAVSGGRNG